MPRYDADAARRMAHRQGLLKTWVYFVTDGEAIKIGKGHPEDRRGGLQTGNPRELTILAGFRASSLDEGAVHHFFRDLRIRGEWFKPDQRIHDAIEKLKAANAALLSGAKSIEDVLYDREGLTLSQIKSPELRQFHEMLGRLSRQTFEDPSELSRVICLHGNLHFLEKCPELAAVRNILADDIAFVQAVIARREAANTDTA